MFVEKLTKDQVREFLKSARYDEEHGYGVSIGSIGGNTIDIYCENLHGYTDYGFYIRLEDFDADMSFPGLWIEFLLKTFGKQYRKEYNKRICI